MNMNEMIRNKRKEHNLTQEQLAEFLGVSTPAVNKWEKGNSYPDITLLPVLARILRVDINTLLCFNEKLSETEIDDFVDKTIMKTIKDKGFDAGFEMAMQKIKEYPNCELLMYYTALGLEGAMMMFDVKNKTQYQIEIEKLYRRAADSDNFEVSNNAKTMLIYKHLDEKKYQVAQEMLDKLPNMMFDKNRTQANLYLRQEKYDEASEILESTLIQKLSEIQGILTQMVQIAMEQGRESDAEYYANIADKTGRMYDLWEYSCCVPNLIICSKQKDVEKSLEMIEKMIDVVKQKWDIHSSLLYKHIPPNDEYDIFHTQIITSLLGELESNEEYEYLHSDTRFIELLQREKAGE